MNSITRSINDWIDIFKEIEKIKKSNYSNIVRDTILVVNHFQQQKLSYLREKSYLLDLMVKYEIYSFDDILLLFSTIKDFYSLESLIDSLNYLKNDYHVDKLCLTNNFPYVIETFYNCDEMKRVILPRELELHRNINSISNGVIDNVIYEDEFIVEEINIKKQKRERIFYTNSFHMNLANFRLEEKINLQFIEEERDQYFQFLFQFFKDKILDIKIENPNILLDSPFLSFDNYKTYHTDGRLFSSYNDVLNPGNYVYQTDQILVKNAYFVFIAHIVDHNISSVSLIIHKKYYEHIKELGIILENTCPKLKKG